MNLFVIKSLTKNSKVSLCSCAETFFTSRWMNAVMVQCDDIQKAAIEILSFVESMELVAPGVQLVGGRVQQKNNKRVKHNTPYQKTNIYF